MSAHGQGQALMEQLLAAYQEPWRKYHTLQHLKECLVHLDRYRHLAQRPGEIEAAIWFTMWCTASEPKTTNRKVLLGLGLHCKQRVSIKKR